MYFNRTQDTIVYESLTSGQISVIWSFVFYLNIATLYIQNQFCKWLKIPRYYGIFNSVLTYNWRFFLLLFSVSPCWVIPVHLRKKNNVCSVFFCLWGSVGFLCLIAVFVLYFLGGHISSYSDIENDTLKSLTIY